MQDAINKNTGENVPPFDLCERTFQFALRILNLSAHLNKQPLTGCFLNSYFAPEHPLVQMLKKAKPHKAVLTLFLNTQ